MRRPAAQGRSRRPAGGRARRGGGRAPCLPLRTWVLRADRQRRGPEAGGSAAGVEHRSSRAPYPAEPRSATPGAAVSPGRCRTGGQGDTSASVLFSLSFLPHLFFLFLPLSLSPPPSPPPFPSFSPLSSSLWFHLCPLASFFPFSSPFPSPLLPLLFLLYTSFFLACFDRLSVCLPTLRLPFPAAEHAGNPGQAVALRRGVGLV